MKTNFIPAVLLLSSSLMNAQSGKVMDNLSMKSKILSMERKYAIYIPVDQKKAVRWYIDCGDDDFLYEGNSLVHIAMRQKEIPHECRMRDGGHTWTYWRTALPVVLEFVSMSFHQF